MAVGGGGVVGLIFLVVTLLAGGDPSGIAPQTLEEPGQQTTLSAECQTGADANAKADCRIAAVVNSVQEHWQRNLQGYQPAQTVFFTAGTNTGCGAATSAVGPFYCPPDGTIYIDLAFYEDLRTQFGATGGPFAEAYVIAHEYGHHVENLLGILDRSRDNRTGENSNAVRVELMADCLAGAWANGAMKTGLIEEITEQDIRDGLNAASAIGDDRIQQRARGQVDRESWTHGSAEQRQRWFRRGLTSPTVDQCNTFNTATV